MNSGEGAGRVSLVMTEQGMNVELGQDAGFDSTVTRSDGHL